MRASLIGFFLAIVAASPFAIAAGPDAGASATHFEKKVRPLLAAKCWRCHRAEQAKGGLRLDTGEAVAKGGESGPVVSPGKPEESVLIEAVLYAGDLKMPPKGKLGAAEIADLTEWVRSGAIWPSENSPRPATSTASSASGPPSLEQGRSFWAFQKPRDVPPPAVKGESWLQSPLDRFILAALEDKGLEPAPAVDKRALIRRATFDLTGLPPTPQEVEAFLADPSAEAFAKVVDRLLASPHYGERWGRHWLDLARFADSNGMDENVAYANAYRYRDYVIRAFNADRPYTQFLKEQIAGDLLPRTDDENANRDRLAATGFLVLGPKMLAEDDPVKMEMDIIDEQVDTVGKVFMGLTLGCARCHDHKFDPIPTADYYSLAGIFKSTKSMQNHKVVAMWNERLLASPAEIAALEAHKKEAARRAGEIQKSIDRAKSAILHELRSRVGDYLPAAWQLDQVSQLITPTFSGGAGEQTPGIQIREAERFERGNVLVDTQNYGRGVGVILNRGELPNYTEYVFDIPEARAYQVELRYASAEPRPVRVLLDGSLLIPKAAQQTTGSFDPETQAWFPQGLHAFKAGRHTIRLESDGAFPHFDKIAIVPRTLPDNLSLADLKPVDELARDRQLNPRLLERWRHFISQTRSDPASLFQGLNKDRRTLDPSILSAIDAEPKPATIEALAQRYQELFNKAAQGPPEKLAPALVPFRRLIDAANGPFALSKKPEEDFAPETAKEIRQAREELAAFEKKAPAFPQAMGVEEQKATNLRVHIRGNHLTLGEEVPRRFLRVVAGESQVPIDQQRSGRLELADWLSRADHPMTARVMVNRLWLWHFGEGLVRSPDNFGQLGDRPTQLDLLDWLSHRFIESGWSVKAMHRLIMLSATYQMGTRYDAKAAQLDPENRLHWRMNRRRLEAEAIRDALLAVSGELDPTMGGTVMTAKNHEYVFSTVGGMKLAYNLNRRSVYLPVIRSALYDVFQALDFPDPSSSNGQRIPTTVAPQALFMMNDPLVLRCSEAMAHRLVTPSGLDDAERIQRAYLSAYGRPPTEKEVSRAESYLQRFTAALEAQGVGVEDRPARAWQALCQSLLSASEFIYLN